MINKTKKLTLLLSLLSSGCTHNPVLQKKTTHPIHLWNIVHCSTIAEIKLSFFSLARYTHTLCHRSWRCLIDSFNFCKFTSVGEITITKRNETEKTTVCRKKTDEIYFINVKTKWLSRAIVSLSLAQCVSVLCVCASICTRSRIRVSMDVQCVFHTQVTLFYQRSSTQWIHAIVK